MPKQQELREERRHERVQKLGKSIEYQQRLDARRLRAAIVGRQLRLPPSAEVNALAGRELPRGAQYLQHGHIALAYILSKEIRAHLGKTFYNSAQVNLAVSAIGATARTRATIGRGALFLQERSDRSPKDGKLQFWVAARAGKGTFFAPHQGQPLDPRKEELKVANMLLGQEGAAVGGPIMYLGAIAAASPEDANVALEVFEDILPSRMPAGRASILYSSR